MKALHLTPAALHWLQTTTTARCLSWHKQVGNLVNQDNALLSLVTQRHLLTPFALELAVAPQVWEQLNAQAIVRVGSRALQIDALEVVWKGAGTWNPTPNWGLVRQRLATHPPAVLELIEWARPRANRKSLLHFAYWPASPLAERFAQGLQLLTEGLRAKDDQCCLRGAERLVGAGGGLTPAGDDFLLGVFLAVWAHAPQAWLAALPLAQTTTLSGAFLQAAARGECAVVWHRLLRVLGVDAAQAQRAAQMLLAFGFTSGADALAGFGWAWAVLTEH